MKKEPEKVLHTILWAKVGAARYGTLTNNSDNDIFVLTPDVNTLLHRKDEDSSEFIWPVDSLRIYWGHPLLLGNITGNCSGNKRLVDYLQDHRYALSYAAPGRSAYFGLDYIAVGERYQHTSPIKAGLRTAMILSHMAEKREDPFLLDEEEKAVLLQARTGGVLPKERVEIYRRTICPENLDKLRRMPENTTVKAELFTLLDEICKEEIP